MLDDKGSDSDSDDGQQLLGLGGLDFSGVDFDRDSEANKNLPPFDRAVLDLEQEYAFGNISMEDFLGGLDGNEKDVISGIIELGQYLASGKYIDVLKSNAAEKLLCKASRDSVDDVSTKTVASEIRSRIFQYVNTLVDCVEVEFIGIAALNLFLQLNYTGPSLDDGITGESYEKKSALCGINPHACFLDHFCVNILSDNESSDFVDAESGEKEREEVSITTSSHVHTKYHNSVLSELAVDGEWPCQVCEVPYLLLIARSILLTLANPSGIDWMKAVVPKEAMPAAKSSAPVEFCKLIKQLSGAYLWSARASVAHGRLLQSRETSQTLWKETEGMFQTCLEQNCPDDLIGEIVAPTCSENSKPKQTRMWNRRRKAAVVMLEWGLAQHHFNRPKMGRKSFYKAKEFSGLTASLTGADGKRTRFQTKSTAQMLVEAVSTPISHWQKENSPSTVNTDIIREQKVDVEEELLLERIKFEDESKNEIKALNVLDQAILLSLCLDVKNSNPTGDELTAEEMGAYLSRVLDHNDDWMLYSTALLERAWLEFQKTHGRERAILQIQALADQHTNRLTLTQSTKKSIEDSAPAQDRLRNLHIIVYPPRWAMIKDLADRYANLGIFMSAAELYTQIELWDEVVECYRRSGRESKAEEIVRERLAIQQTPRMWAALGDVTQDPQYWEKAIELSKGRFSTAFVALGAYYFEKGDLVSAAEYYTKALEARPVAPAVWFRLGTISMQLSRWDEALRAFSRVVQLEPEEHEAWANVGAIHMRNKNPSEAYPALAESLKYFRGSWRVWTSKLYVCLDLKKYDEAVQACNSILDLKNQKQASDGIPPLEERCIRAIVGGTLQSFHESIKQQQEEKRKEEADTRRTAVAALDSSKRSLARVHALLDRLQSTSNPEPWLFETIAFFHEQVGGEGSQQVIDNLMKEYRALQTVPGWEKDDKEVEKVCTVARQIVSFHRRNGRKENLSKSKFLLRGIIQKVHKSRLDDSKVPTAVDKLESLLRDLEEEIQQQQQQQ